MNVRQSQGDTQAAVVVAVVAEKMGSVLSGGAQSLPTLAPISLGVNATTTTPLPQIGPPPSSDICVDDPLYFYLVLAAIDLLAYCWPCVKRRRSLLFGPVGHEQRVHTDAEVTNRRVRGILFALNVSLAANLLLAVYISPIFPISVFFVLGVGAMAGAFYAYSGTVSLMVTVILTVGVCAFTLQSFLQQWVSTLLGVQLSYGETSFLFIALACAAGLVVYFADTNAF